MHFRLSPAFPSVSVHCAILLFAVAAVGCGTRGNAPSETVTSLSIRVPNEVFIAGTSATLMAVETLVSGATLSPPAAQWSSDDPSVAAVDPASGILTPAKNGSTSIRLSVNRLTTSIPIRVVPNFQGNWAGRTSWHGCKSTNDEARVLLCGHTTVGVVSVNLTQDGDRVQGTLSIVGNGSNRIPVTGSIDANGVVTLAATTPWVYDRSTETMTNWTSSVTATDMTGEFTIHGIATDGSSSSADDYWALYGVSRQN